MQKQCLKELTDLTGKTAIVTGGASGIGRAIVHRLHEAGANVVLADIDEKIGTAVANELNELRRHSAAFVACNVSKPRDIEETVTKTVAIFGSLDIMVNNAGIYPLARLDDLDEDLFDKIIATDLRSVYLFTRLASAQMIKQGHGGKIINVASVDAIHPSSAGLAAYDASKHGVWGFTKTVALELAEHKIWVNAIAPGAILTPGVKKMTGGNKQVLKLAAEAIPMRRLGDPDDIGRIALFLASDLASFMTGSMVVADGGMLLQ